MVCWARWTFLKQYSVAETGGDKHAFPGRRRKRIGEGGGVGGSRALRIYNHISPRCVCGSPRHHLLSIDISGRHRGICWPASSNGCQK